MLIQYDRPHKPAEYSAVATITSATAVELTAPTGARYAVVKVISNPIRVRDDGTAPTSVSGFSLEVGDIVNLLSREQIAGFKAIAQDGNAGLEISYYTI